MFTKPDGTIEWAEVIIIIAAVGAGYGLGRHFAPTPAPPSTPPELEATRAQLEAAHAELGTARAGQEQAREEARAARTEREAAQAAQRAAQAALDGATASARAAAAADLEAARQRALVSQTAATTAERRAAEADMRASNAQQAAEAARVEAERRASARARAGLGRVADLAVRRAALRQEIATLEANPAGGAALRAFGIAGIRTIFAAVPNAHMVVRWRLVGDQFEPFTDTPVSEQLAARIAAALRAGRVSGDPNLTEAERLLRMTPAAARWPSIASLLQTRRAVDDIEGTVSDIRARLDEKREELAQVEREFVAASTAVAGDAPSADGWVTTNTNLTGGADGGKVRAASGVWDGSSVAQSAAMRRRLVVAAGALNGGVEIAAAEAARAYLGLVPSERVSVWSAVNRTPPAGMPSEERALARAVADWMRGAQGAPDGWGFYRAALRVSSARIPGAVRPHRVISIGRSSYEADA